MRTDRRIGLGRLLLILASLAVIAVGAASALRLAEAAPSPTDTQSSAPASPPAASAVAPATVTASGPGRPVAIDIPVATSHHPHGLHARITAHGLNPDETLFVPADPTEVAWASDDAAPGSDRGTAILVSHVNYVINGRTVDGAFADLAEYGRRAIGRIFTVELADGRMLRFRFAGSREYSKDDLAADPQLRRALYNQTQAFGTGGTRSGRLLLVSCGGPFDPQTGEYEDNVFVFALPVR